MKIYIASSFRNVHAVRLLRDTLAETGHQVLDWSAYAPPLPAHLAPEKRRKMLDSDERGVIFNFCKNACGSADLVIYLGPSGQDAACELGLAHAAGVLILGLAGPLEAAGLIINGVVNDWCTDTSDLLRRVEAMAVTHGGCF